MKKIISMLLVIAMCLSLCACGGDGSIEATEKDFEDILCSETWHSIMRDPIMYAQNAVYTLNFEEDGTGTYKYSVNSQQFTWTLENDTVTIELGATVFSDGISVLNIVKEENVIKLVEETNAFFYVLESNYESEKNKMQPPMEEVFVEVVNNGGEVEHIGAAEILRINNINEVQFKNKYYGASVTVVSEVLKVHGRTEYNGHMMEAYVELKGGWIVEVADEMDVASLMPGDIVKVTGDIFSAFGFHIHLYIVNDSTTTIELYAE